MIVQVFYDGMKEQTSAKGTVYADLFGRGATTSGDPDLEQSRYRTFNEGVIKAARLWKPGDLVELDLRIRDATVEGVGK